MEKIEKIDCKLKTDSMHTKLSAPNTFWLTFGTLVKQSILQQLKNLFLKYKLYNF